MKDNYYIDDDMTDAEMEDVLDRLESVAYSRMARQSDSYSSPYNKVWSAIHDAWYEVIKMNTPLPDEATADDKVGA